MGNDTRGDSEAGRPVQGEVGARVVREAARGRLGVLREARLGVGTDGAALGAVVVLLGEVLGVGVAKDAASVLAWMFTCSGFLRA